MASKRKTARRSVRKPAALIEQHDVIGRGIEELSVHRYQSAAWPAVKEHDRNALGIPDSFIVDLVNIGDLQHPRIEGFDLRIERFHMVK